MTIEIEDIILEVIPDLRLPVPDFLISRIAVCAAEVGVLSSRDKIVQKIQFLRKEIKRKALPQPRRTLPKGMKPAHILAQNKPHATRIKYLGGCRCLPCRAANSNYSVERDRRKRLGIGNPLVPADRARRHIEKMSRLGVGYKTLAKSAGVACSITAKIRNGQRKQIRKETEQRILDAKPQPVGKAIIDARPTWRLINRLLSEGFTKAELARRLGLGKTLQLNKHRITAKNAQRVCRFYETIMAI